MGGRGRDDRNKEGGMEGGRIGGVGRRQRGSKAGREGVKQGEREEGDRVEREMKRNI